MYSIRVSDVFNVIHHSTTSYYGTLYLCATLLFSHFLYLFIFYFHFSIIIILLLLKEASLPLLYYYEYFEYRK